MTANTAILGWTARLVLDGESRSESWNENDLDTSLGDDRNAWTRARDTLVDDFLERLEDRDPVLHETLSTLLCDADPEASFVFAHAGVRVALEPIRPMDGAHRVEKWMLDTVIVRDDGTPIATLHVVDPYYCDDDSGIDEAEASRLATIAARALDAAMLPPLLKDVHLSRFDEDTYQVIATPHDGDAYEYAVVARHEEETDKALETRAQRLVQLLGDATRSVD